MRSVEVIAAIAGAVSLASCAGSDAASGSGHALSLEQKMSLHLAGVTAEVGRDVTMTKEALDRIVEHVTSDIRADAPGVFENAATPGAPPALTMKLVFTQYAGGGESSKFERRSVGVIRIDADVLFVDASGKTVAQSKVAARFGSGGDVGLTTDISNVEDDFERTVARLIR